MYIIIYNFLHSSCISIDIVYDNDLTDALVGVLKEMIKLDLRIFRCIYQLLISPSEIIQQH